MSKIVEIGVVLGIAAVFVLPLLFAMTSERKLLRRLRARPIMGFDEWFEKYYPGSALDKDVVRRFYEFFAEQAFPVHPTQILPTDRFAVELTCPAKWYEMEDDIDLWEVVVFFLENYGVDSKKMTYSHETVGQVVEEVCRLVAGKQPKQQQPVGRLGKVIGQAVIAGLLIIATITVAVIIWRGVKWLGS